MTESEYIVAGSEKIIRTFMTTITLPANQNPYAPNDVITDISGNLSRFTNVAKAAGAGVNILSVRIQSTDSGLSGKNFRCHFYNDSITPIADNSPFVISDENYLKREGNTQITIGTSPLNKVGQANYENIMLCPVERDIYMVLEDIDGHTPSANSTIFNVFIKCELTN